MQEIGKAKGKEYYANKKKSCKNRHKSTYRNFLKEQKDEIEKKKKTNMSAKNK